MLNYEYPPLGGGAANATYYILKEFSQKDGIEIDLVTSSATSKFEIERIGKNITIYKLPINKKEIHYWTQKEIFLYSLKALKYINKLNVTNYDLIHAFFGIPCGAVAYLFRKKIPYIVSLRGSDVPGFNSRFSSQYVFLKPITKQVWKASGAIIANSKGLKELALKTDEKAEIDIIYNGISIEEFSAKTDYHKEYFTALTVARLIERKGIDDLIRAIHLLVRDGVTNVNLKIIGKGNMEEQLKALSTELNVTEYINFLEYVPHEELSFHYLTSDVFVLPSKNEGMSNTVLEAMASGLPIITTDTGGTAELIDGNGIIVPINSPHSIKNAILRYNNSFEIKRKHGIRSKEIAEKLNWNEIMKEYFEIYKMML